MAVNHVEIRDMVRKLVEQNCVGADWISVWSTQTQRTRDDRYKFGSGDRVAAGKQGHLVAKVNQFLGEP
jgi:hypothetical protein